MIGIKRNTGVSGSFFSMKIYINDQEVTRIKEGQQIELELPNDEAKIYVSQFENHSNELIIKDGQVVEITNSSWLYFSFITIFVLLILISIFLPFNYRIIGFIFVIILSIALSYFKNGFDLEVIYP
ncbi:MAG: hypothetical protein L0L07_08420 [Staphylococcus equorum]|nr:hypothetical protein [Staphylococcus equorum]